MGHQDYPGAPGDGHAANVLRERREHLPHAFVDRAGDFDDAVSSVAKDKRNSHVAHPVRMSSRESTKRSQRTRHSRLVQGRAPHQRPDGQDSKSSADAFNTCQHTLQVASSKLALLRACSYGCTKFRDCRKAWEKLPRSCLSHLSSTATSIRE